ncbi:Av71 muscle cell intermediate filament [Xanthomonas oryzae pv. oryzicola]|nr:Av71 muscle cell intermediate filament [Xanthomonas oryzae pv. oryzicola]
MTLRHPPSAIRHPPSAIRHPPTAYRLPPTAYRRASNTSSAPVPPCVGGAE